MFFPNGRVYTFFPSNQLSPRQDPVWTLYHKNAIDTETHATDIETPRQKDRGRCRGKGRGRSRGRGRDTDIDADK